MYYYDIPNLVVYAIFYTAFMIAIAPVGTLAVAWLFEGMKHPSERLGIGSSKGFVWSNLAYGLILGLATLGDDLAPRRYLPNGWTFLDVIYRLVAFLVVTYIVLRARYRDDAPKYNKSAANAPSKLYNDIVSYGVLPYLLLTRVVPWFFTAPLVMSANSIRAIIVLLIIGMAIGTLNPSSLNRNKIQPSDWRGRNELENRLHPDSVRAKISQNVIGKESDD